MFSPAKPSITATRRTFLRNVGGAMAAAVVVPNLKGLTLPVLALPVAVTDIALGLRHSTGAFAVARHAGARGVDVDFGRLGVRPVMDSRLTDTAGRQRFLDAAREAGMRISSLTMNAFAEQSFADHPKAETYVDDLIYALTRMNVRVGVLPIGRDCDLGDGAVYQRCVARLRAVAPIAERNGVILAVDCGLPPAGVGALLDAVGSPAVHAVIAAGPAGGVKAAVAHIGVQRIAQVRFKYDDAASQAVVLEELREAFTSAQWPGWVVIDRPAASAGNVLGDATLAAGRLASALSTDLA